MMKEELFFLATWVKVKEASWSGTTWSLHQALSPFYEIQDVCVKRPFMRRVFNKLFPCMHDMELGNLLHYRRELKGQLKEGKVLQFGEFCEDTDKLHTYVYKDLSVSYLEYMSQKNPSAFAHSGFAHIPLRSIERKARIEREYHAGCSGVFTMSGWLRDFLIEHDGIAPDKVHHVGGGINVDKSLIRGELRTGNKLLFVGRDFVRKGGDLVYEAFKRLREEMEGVELHVAGPATDPISDPVEGYHYHGDVASSQLPALLNQCDVFCLPSRFEAYGLVFPEAMCYGLPCIGRDAQEMPRFIEDGQTGLLLRSDDAAELASCMKELLTNSLYRDNVCQRRERYLEEYSWSAVARRIHNVMG